MIAKLRWSNPNPIQMRTVWAYPSNVLYENVLYFDDLQFQRPTFELESENEQNDAKLKIFTIQSLIEKVNFVVECNAALFFVLNSLPLHTQIYIDELDDDYTTIFATYRLYNVTINDEGELSDGVAIVRVSAELEPILYTTCADGDLAF